MKVKRKIACLGVALLASRLITVAEGEEPKKCYVHAGHLKRMYVRGPDVEELDIENGVIHADLRRGKHRYLLITDTEPSRPGNPMARCGGGVESYLYWLDLIDTTVVAAQSAHYYSCWQSIEGGNPTWGGTHFSVRYEKTEHTPGTDDPVLVRSVAAFDSNAPEKGLEVINQPPEKMP